MTTIAYARPSAAPVRCWLCGTDKGPLRDDIHVKGHLCPSCWTLRPRGSNTWARAASALAAQLTLGPYWTDSGFRQTWLQNTARRHHITAWHDTPTGSTAPAEPFGWITTDVFDQAAADLQAREEEFQRSRVGASRTARPSAARTSDPTVSGCGAVSGGDLEEATPHRPNGEEGTG